MNKQTPLGSVRDGHRFFNEDRAAKVLVRPGSDMAEGQRPEERGALGARLAELRLCARWLVKKRRPSFFWLLFSAMEIEDS